MSRKPIKICQNPECRDEIIKYTSAKKKYCNDECRRRAWYLDQKTKYQEYNYWLKANKQQLKIIELFVLKQKFEVHKTTLEDLGLDLSLWQYPERTKLAEPIYRIGKYYLNYNDQSKKVTIKTK